MQFQYVCSQADVMIGQVKRTMIIASVITGSVLALPFKHLTLPLLLAAIGFVMYGIGIELIDWKKERDSLSDDEKQRVRWTLKRKHMVRYMSVGAAFSIIIAFGMFHATNWLVWIVK